MLQFKGLITSGGIPYPDVKKVKWLLKRYLINEMMIDLGERSKRVILPGIDQGSCQIQTVLSPLPEANRFPSGAQAILVTKAVWPVRW